MAYLTRNVAYQYAQRLFSSAAILSASSLLRKTAAGQTWNLRLIYGIVLYRWLGSQVVSVLDSGAEQPGFKSQPRCCRVTVLGKLLTPIVPLFTKQRNR